MSDAEKEVLLILYVNKNDVLKEEIDVHTFDGKSCTIHYNGDFSDEAIISNKDGNAEICVDTQDLIDFIAEYVRSKKVGRLENMNSDEIFGVK